MIKEVIEGQEVYFHNWWPHSCYKDEWFYQFIKYRNLATIDYPIHFFSVFGDRNLVRYYADRQQTADSRQQTADSRQQTADSRQQTADSRQQTADSRQQTAQQTADSRQQTADSRQQTNSQAMAN